MAKRWALALSVFTCLAAAQTSPPFGAVQVKQGIEKLQRLGSVLMIAAHPDDENSALLAYFAQGRKMRTAYLSLTRGEGGQNLIGPEQGPLLGLIRTQELLAARRIDLAEQFFTRAIDFGYSKTAGETLRKWGREEVLGDIVWNIRRFRPDVIISRWSGTPRDGHGHHQSAGILATEAFAAAADPKRFPEQLKDYPPWQAKRIFWNVSTYTAAMRKEAQEMPGTLKLDAGEFNAELGYSYAEIAGLSWSQQRSQGFGRAQVRGSSMEYLLLRAGEPAASDPFEGIKTGWDRIPGGGAVATLLEEAATDFRIDNPAAVVPKLLEARQKLEAFDDSWSVFKKRELDELILRAAGIWLDGVSSKALVSPGQTFDVVMTAINRSHLPVTLEDFRMNGADEIVAQPLRQNQPKTWTAQARLEAYTQPYWLEKPPGPTRYVVDERQLIGLPESPPPLKVRFGVKIAGRRIEVDRTVANRYVDPVRGELSRPLVSAPRVVVSFTEPVAMFPVNSPKKLDVQLKANAPGEGSVSVDAPPDWKVTPSSRAFRLSEAGASLIESFEVTPPAADARADLHAVVRINGSEIRQSMKTAEYEHIPPQIYFPEAVTAAVRTDARVLARNVGYVMGAGDDVPKALGQLGVNVAMLSADDLAASDLGRFDAIVTGVRAFNVRKDLAANYQRLMDYVSRGGTLIVQYYKTEVREPVPVTRVGPYPFKVSFDRVTEEDAPVRTVKPDHPLLQSPNRIEAKDYEGWVQERGAYFARDWDPRYETIWEMSDPGESPTQGGTLYARVGKGVYIYSPLAWFRQLPAGVPGAYRIFANLLSASKTISPTRIQ